MLRQDELQRIDSDDGALDMFRNSSSIWDDLGVTYLLRCAASRKWLLLVIPVLWIGLSNAWFAVSQDKYLGELQVVPATIGMGGPQRSGESLSGILSNFGFGDLAGASDQGMFSVYTESWTAPWFAQDLVDNVALSRRIFHDDWSASANAWKEPNPPLTRVGRFLKRFFGDEPQPWAPPNTEDMLTFLKKNVKIEQARGQAITFVTLEGGDRGLIRDLLTYGHRHIEDHLRRVFQQRADENIAYILQQLSQVTVAEYRTALVDDLAEQEKIKMMAFANEDFVAQPLGIFVTASPIWPRTVLVVGLSLLAALVLYALLVVFVARRQRPAGVRGAEMRPV